MDERSDQPKREDAPEPMYDVFSVDYDRFVDWDGRLAAEIPFIEAQLESVGAERVLDVACGTGMHGIALAERGYEVVGVDSSGPMIEEARANAAKAAVEVDFQVAAFGGVVDGLASADLRPAFDAAICLGNSLPHVMTPDQLDEALEDLAASLLPGGLLLIQNRNFDAVLSTRDRWMSPQGYRRGAHEWLFVRFYDFEPSGLLTFNVLTLHRGGDEPWHQRLTSTKLWPLTRLELVPALKRAGFTGVTGYGDMQGAPYDPTSSPNLVVAAFKAD
jgi:SAM-dependent methyltransferase